MSVNNTKSANMKAASELLEILTEQLKETYADPRKTLRASHAKTVALLRGEFIVGEEGLPADLRHGLFAKTGTFPCWIRFSQCSSEKHSDDVKDFYGCSIKLLGSDGSTPLGQDFIFVNHPVDPLGLPQVHLLLWKYSRRSVFILLWHALITGYLLRIFGYLTSKTVPHSLFGERYYSQTPFGLGNALKPVKYGLFPSPGREKCPLTSGYNRLTDEMTSTLAHCAAVEFDFTIQVQTNASKMPLDDAAIEWNQSLSPFIKAAKIRIPSQTFDTFERRELSEVLTFTVSNALEEHRPLGILNRVRELIYQSMSKFRHERAQRGESQT